MLEKETAYFKNHKKELVGKFPNCFIVIVGEDVVGVFNTEIEAYTDAISKYELGKFLLVECTEREEQPRIFHSRVSFH